MIECRPATLKDLPQLYLLIGRLQASPFKTFLASSAEDMESFLLNSLTFPQNCVLLISSWEGTICGIAAMMLVVTPALNRVPAVSFQDRHCFIHAAYIDASINKQRVPMAVGKLQWQTMKQWGLDRGANYIYGNCRLDGHFKGWERQYGLKKMHVVIGTTLEAGDGIRQ